MNIRQQTPGVKPQWQFTAKTGKVVRTGRKGGIDWYRYQKKVLIPKLLTFALKCKEARPDTCVQEDKAPAHASKYQDTVYLDFGIFRLFWPGNSPDLNIIEPCWAWMKRQTSKYGLPRTRKEAERRWLKCWNE